jgi:uncharacterized protein YndB with AHSA1/START domain
MVAQDRIERDILIDAPVDVVWAVVTEPQHISGWFSDSVQLDLRPGGEARLHWDGHGTFHGRVERVEPPHFFSFRWVVDPDQELVADNSTLVEFTLSADGDSTRLTVVESGFRDERHFDDHRRGWEIELGHLDDYFRTR